ncbi:MAG: hypothetical protein U1E61_21260 [Bradyrhizobium sp.]
MGLIKGFAVLVFVVLGLAAAWSTYRRPGRRVAVNLLIAYTILLSFAVGFSQRESWPFSTWPFIAGRVARPSTFPRIVAIDAQGKEYQIDYRAWEPFEFDEIMAWKDRHFAGFDTPTKDRVAAYLLNHVDTARQQWAASERRHYFDRFFGPLSAPLFLGHRAYWDAAVPDRPLTGLRFYQETWDVEQRARDPSSISRRLVYEYRRP